MEKPKEHVKSIIKTNWKNCWKTNGTNATPIQNTPVEKLKKLKQFSFEKTVLSENEKRILKQNIYLKLDIKSKKKTYPKIAKRLNHTGKVHVTFTITKRWKNKKLKLHKSTEFESLNQAALEILKQLLVLSQFLKTK